MRSKKNPKPCPFCFGVSYSYKTENGLIRHVMNNHLTDSTKRLIFPPLGTVVYVAKETGRGIEFIPINGKEEVEQFLHQYFRDFKNPSHRNSKLWRYI